MHTSWRWSTWSESQLPFDVYGLGYFEYFRLLQPLRGAYWSKTPLYQQQLLWLLSLSTRRVWLEDGETGVDFITTHPTEPNATICGNYCIKTESYQRSFDNDTVTRCKHAAFFQAENSTRNRQTLQRRPLAINCKHRSFALAMEDQLHWTPPTSALASINLSKITSAK